LKLAAVLDRAGMPRKNVFRPNGLQATGTDQFTVGSDEITLKFKRDSKGAATEFALDAGRTTGVTFVRTGGNAP
jgi:hypothetical protein